MECTGFLCKAGYKRLYNPNPLLNPAVLFGKGLSLDIVRLHPRAMRPPPVRASSGKGSGSWHGRTKKEAMVNRDRAPSTSGSLLSTANDLLKPSAQGQAE